MNIFASTLRIQDDWKVLEDSLEECSFCRMRWNVAKHLNKKTYPLIFFERVGSMLQMNEGLMPVLTVRSGLGLRSLTNIQIGIPNLPLAGSQSFFKILRHWLKTCDEHHHCCSTQPEFVPKRLIDVGDYEAPTVQLHETHPTERLKYLALSYRWGFEPPHFCTFRRDVENYKEKICVSNLTQTMRDAVKVTRALGIQYLWIDSICVIQRDEDDPGDFVQEAPLMGEIFSSAYCVMAASSAERQADGFLDDHDRCRQDYVTIKSNRDQPLLHICPFIDDFSQDVLKSPLSERGWVMQERVLARRTIYFAKGQSYFECGEGVRCETLTKMDNKLASFLGDPRFPSKITSDMTSHGERIIFYENLYKQYSRLGFAYPHDRAIGIAGLEKRLIDNLGAQGGFGVFDDGTSLLQRGLMWQRGKEMPTLKKIAFPQDDVLHVVPSWSWMAYEGGIDFLEMPMGQVDWEADEVESPWLLTGAFEDRNNGEVARIELHAIARDFEVHEATAIECVIVYDIPHIEIQPTKCVVMGRLKGAKSLQDATHYVLIVTPTDLEGSAGTYARVGVGYMPGRCIDLQPSKAIRKISIR